MATTIQVQDDTLDLLKRYKEQHAYQTYDQTIKALMSLGDYAKSFRGFLGKKDMAFVMKGLRDKKDR